MRILSTRRWLSSTVSTVSREPFAKNFDQYYDQACKRIHATGGLLSLIRKPDVVYRCSFPLVRDNGDMEVIHGLRVVHSHHVRPSKGGVMFDLGMTEDETGALACLNSLRFAVSDIPWAGAKGVVLIDRTKYSPRELKQITKQYARLLLRHNYLGPSNGLVSPDYGVGHVEMGTFLSAYKDAHPQDVHVIATVVGKSVSQGGLRGQDEVYGAGFCHAIEECVRQRSRTDPILASSVDGRNFSFKGRTVAIQGLGYIGRRIAKHVIESGGAVVAVIEKNSAVVNTKGIDVPAIIEYMHQNHTLHGFDPVHETKIEKALGTECDVFIPAAKQNVLDGSNAGFIRAPIVAECALCPITPAAETILEDRGAFIIPDMCTTPAADHYTEWLKGIAHVRLGRLEKRFEEASKTAMLEILESHAQTKLRLDTFAAARKGVEESVILQTTVMQGVTDIAEKVAAEAVKERLNFRIAALKISIETICKFYSAAGVFP